MNTLPRILCLPASLRQIQIRHLLLKL